MVAVAGEASVKAAVAPDGVTTEAETVGDFCRVHPSGGALMGGRHAQTFKKTQKEQRRKEKREAKLARKLERKQQGPPATSDEVPVVNVEDSPPVQSEL